MSKTIPIRIVDSNDIDITDLITSHSDLAFTSIDDFRREVENMDISKFMKIMSIDVVLKSTE